MSEHSEHIARRLADGWYALHTCQECKREFNSPSTPKPLSLEQTAKLVYDTCCDIFGPGHEEHSVLIISKAIRQARAEVLAACVAKLERDARNCFAAADKADAEGRGGTYESWRRTAAQYQNIAEDFKQFQPAASDLEEYTKSLSLSEIARIKGLYGLASVNKPEERPVFHAEDE